MKIGVASTTARGAVFTDEAGQLLAPVEIVSRVEPPKLKGGIPTLVLIEVRVPVDGALIGHKGPALLRIEAR